MADVEAAAAAFLENEIAQQESSQLTEIADEQAVAPASPFEALQARLEEHPYDTVAWQDLINVAEESGNIKHISAAYSSLLKVYPNTVQAQIAYLRHSQRAFPLGKPTTQDQVQIPTPQTLFSQWLKQSPDVELWKLYLEYVRANQSSSGDVVKKAYEFALRFVGQDRDAGEIWKDYIEYIKADSTSTEREGQEKMDLLRSVYRRAVQIPLDNLEQIWREWDAFENGLNKITAKKFLADVSPDYMTARTKKTELAEYHKRIRLYPPPTYGERASLDLPVPPIMRSEERSLLASWRKYLEFEESNPLEIDEKSMLNARIMAIYRKAVIKMRFYPEVWHLGYLWCQSVGKADDAHNFLKNGLEANPTSFLINFSYTEHQEQAMLTFQSTSGSDPKKIEEKKAEVHDLFRKFSTLLKKELDDFEERHVAEGGNRVSQQPAGANKAAAAVAAPITIEDDIAMKENEIYGVIDPAVAEAKEREKEKARENERMEGILNDKRTELGQASIAWLRYAKRAGQSLGMRNTFKEIRSDKWVCWQVYEAAALLEHQIAPTADVAAKIFELGLRLFSTDVDYVVRYLNFLINKCDEANARALFEKSIGLFEPEKARPIWQRWLMYQMNVADLPTLHKLDKRVAEAYPKDRTMKLLAQRYTYLGGEVVAPPLGIDAIASHDLQTQLRAPSVIPSVSLMAAPTPLVPQHHSPPEAHPSNGASQVYPHSQPHPQHPPNYSAGSSAALPRAPPPRMHSPLPPPKRPLPEQEALGSQKRARRSPPPVRRPPPPPPPRRWGSPPRDDRRRERERSPERVHVPQSLYWFLSHLPNAAVYDGPLFKTDEYLSMLAKANIPPPSSSSRIRSRSPPPRTRGPPDYGPYQGPAARPPRRY